MKTARLTLEGQKEADRAYTEQWNAKQSAWYAQQTTTRLECMRAGAWDANDRQGYAMARAELERRKSGGTLEQHFKYEW